MQAAAAGQLQQYQMLGLHHEAIIDDLTRSIQHLSAELEKTNELKATNDNRMDKLARQIKALGIAFKTKWNVFLCFIVVIVFVLYCVELDKKRVDKEYELKRYNEKDGIEEKKNMFQITTF